MEHQDTHQGNSERGGCLNGVTQLDVGTLQIKEALLIQLDVQQRIYEQLEIQKHLQLRIEEQGRKLKELFDDQQQKANKNHPKNRNSGIIPGGADDDPTI